MQQSGLNSFASFQAVTPSDTTRITCAAIYVGGAGNIALSPDGTTAATTFTAVPVGSVLFVELNQGRIMSTNTTATLLIALA
jgi:hypothetical protein